MDGWVGTFWDLKHVGVTPDLDAILAQDQGRFCEFPSCFYNHSHRSTQASTSLAAAGCAYV